MGELRILTAQEILAIADDESKLARETVPVPELYEGCAIIVREMMSAEQSAFSDFIKDKSNVDSNAKAVSIVIINPDGTRMFNASNVKSLSRLGMRVMHRIVEATLRLSGMDQEAIEARKKKLAEIPDGDSVLN